MTPFSIIVATHRRPSFLGRAIASVKEQGPGLSQLVIVSDAPCADTYAVASSRLDGDDLFIERAGEPGPAESRNTGAQRATGRHLIFLDDDDALSPAFLRDVAPLLDDDSIAYSDFVQVLEEVQGTRSTILKAERRSLGGTPTAALMIKNFIPVSCPVYPSHVAQSRSFDKTIGYEDWDFLLNAMSASQLRHVPVCGPVIYSRPGADNRGSASDTKLEDIYRTIYRRWPAPSSDVKIARQALLASAGIAADLSEL